MNEELHFTHREIMFVYSGLMLGMLLAALDQTIVSTALPTIAADLGGLNHLTWVVIAYILASTISMPLYGKLGDLYGRKKLFQFAIVIFLIGSALCGISQSMLELIAFRALQGLGAGGLMVLALAIIGDIVPPRERGRYQGYIGAVFAVSSVAGPLLGGFFVENLSWRWVFYINLPVGAVALFVVAAVLHLPVRRVTHKLDILGAVLLAVGVTVLTLALELGGTEWAWGSATSVSLFVTGAALIALFVVQERFAAEPIIPLHLFKNVIFDAASAGGFIIGLAMFGSIVYLPLFLQIVHGSSVQGSGLRLLPLMASMLVASVVSGRLISKIGRYKVFPIIGMALVTMGLYLLTHITPSTSYLVLYAYVIVLGIGMGLVMQVLILAVQNAVEYRDMGVATATAVFLRSMGSVFGLAILGAIFSNKLAYSMPRLIPRQALSKYTGKDLLHMKPSELNALPPRVHQGLIDAFSNSIHSVFTWAIPFAIAGFVITLFLREIPLRERKQPAGTAAIGDLEIREEAGVVELEPVEQRR